jgi:superfamily II DNA or RNA helicase
MTNPAPRLLLLAKAASIPDGARWITVHPNGKGTEGQAVLVQPNPDGTAHVIGGAGGKLNYLKLRGVRSESEYKKEAEQKRSAKTEEKKAQRQRDKEAGILESKKSARENVRAQAREHERKYIKKVSDVMGWAPQAEPNVEGLSDAAAAKRLGQHHTELMKRSNQAVDLQRQNLVTDHAARMEAGIGEIPLDAKSPDVISVEDLNPVPQTVGGLGFSSDFKARAEKAGLSSEDLGKEAADVRAATQTDDQRKAAIARGDTAKMIKEELKAIREPAAPAADATLTDARQAVELLKAQKQMRQIHRQARDAGAAIDRSASEPKAHVLEISSESSEDMDAAVAEEINADLRTAQTRAFLSEVGRIAGDRPEETLGKHIGIGAYNSVNSLAQAVGGTALVDRSVLDVLGIAGAAQVLARRIHADMPDDVERITQGMQDFHMHHYMETSAEAIGQAQELMDTAREIELGDAANGADLQVAQELNSRRRKATGDAQKILGQALGEMEANASLSVALKQNKTGDFQVSLGRVGVESAIQRVRAIGLQPGDYKLESVAGDTFLTVTHGGMGKLAKPIEKEDLEQVQRNLGIIRGDQDEDDWLPLGVARRPDIAMDVAPGVAPRMAEPFQPGADLAQSLKDYIGGRAADGDAPGDIVADIQSADFFQKVGADNAGAYREALDSVAPLKGIDGKQRRSEELADTFDGYADKFVGDRYGGTRSTLNRQQFDVDDVAVEALHRALAETPEGVAAYKQVGELDHSDQRALREHFHRNVAKESPEAGALRAEADRLDANEPEKQSTDMFGETVDNPDWSDWNSQRDAATAKVNAAGLDWPKYVEAMRGNANAYESIQDLIRSRVGKSFADAHNRLKPGAPIKVGKSVIRNNLNHLDVTDPAARAERQERERSLIDGLRERSAGRYASGSVHDKLDAARDEREAFDQSQMGFFSTEDAPPAAFDQAPLGGDERHTLGHIAERQIAGMMGKVGPNFKPGQPTKLWAPTMSGGKNAARQRLVKMVDANKRVVAAFGTGSGKSLLQLSAFTNLHGQGKAKRGLFLVPSIVQGQFSGEALRYLEPGKFKWHIQPGASREERIAAYKDPTNHMAVMTHQSFRDDMMHMGAQHAGISPQEMTDRVSAMKDDERKAWAGDIMKREGINFDYLTTDESQYTLNRAGKENSGLANVVDAVSAHTPYYMAASGDPVKNDASEVFDLLRKMDPERYTDSKAFMRRYGADTLSSKDALRREMARYVYPSKIDPDVTADRQTSQVEVSAGQKQALAELDSNFSKARIARMQGKTDVAAMQAISPTQFEGVPADQHEAIAKELQKSLGIMKSSAVQRVLATHPDNPIVDDIVAKAEQRRGKPGVVFAHSLDQVKMIAERLQKAGHRVSMLTGADSAIEKERKRLAFNPESGDASSDILVASDAGATGMNTQRGQWLYQADTPQTAMTHAQRNGRIFRTGQKNNVELIDGVANHPEVHRARDRLQKKYGLRDLMTSPMEALDDTGIAHFLQQRKVAADDSQTSFI